MFTDLGPEHFSQKLNGQRSASDKLHIRLTFPAYPDSCSYVELRGCNQPDPGAGQVHK
jgi:hypothetical protein